MRLTKVSARWLRITRAAYLVSLSVFALMLTIFVLEVTDRYGISEFMDDHAVLATVMLVIIHTSATIASFALTVHLAISIRALCR